MSFNKKKKKVENVCFFTNIFLTFTLDIKFTNGILERLTSKTVTQLYYLLCSYNVQQQQQQQ